MSTAVINIKTDPKVKAKAQKIASELGFSLSALINGYLNQLVRTKTIHFSVLEEEPSEYMIQALKESEEDRKKGRYSSFDSVDGASEFLDNIINENKKS
jgi:addiction module RelB/DinJ family antitoxin